MDATRSTGYFEEIIVDQQSEIDALNLSLSKKH